MLKDMCKYVLCVRCENDYTSDFKNLLCTCCKESLDEDFQHYKNNNFDELQYDLDFYENANSIEDIYEIYGNNGKIVFVDESLQQIKDILNEKYKDCGGVYQLLLEFMLDNDMIIMCEYDHWFDDNTIDLGHKHDLLTLAQNDIKNMLDDNINNRELTDNEKAKQEVYLKYIRHLLELQLFVVNHELENNNK